MTRRRTTVLRLMVALVAAGVVLFPLYWMVVIAFSPRERVAAGEVGLLPRDWTTENLQRVLEGFPVGAWLLNSVSIAVVTALIIVGVNLLAGYALAHLRFRGSALLLLLALATLMLPVQIIMVSLFRLITGLQLYGSYWAVILPTAASAFGIFLARQFMLTIPRELIEAARIDGAGHLGIFWRIVLPLSRPLIAVLFFVSLLQTWNDFAWPLIALRENDLYTLPIGLLYLQGQFGPDYGGTMAFALITVLPMVVLFVLTQRQFVQGFARTGLR